MKTAAQQRMEAAAARYVTRQAEADGTAAVARLKMLVGCAKLDAAIKAAKQEGK